LDIHGSLLSELSIFLILIIPLIGITVDAYKILSLM
jgi:hypothetical protein